MPVPTSCSQKGLLAVSQIVFCRMMLLAPAQTTKPSAMSSAKVVIGGGDPKCMATGRLIRCRMWALPATSPWGIGDSIMATCSYCSSDLSICTALAALSRVPLKSRSIRNCSGTTRRMARMEAWRSYQVRAFSLADM